MSTYILVHGSWHGAWCWHKVVPLLQKRGHTAVAIDLPSSGIDRTPIESVTLQSYTDRVCQALAAYDEPVYLVGHSMGGVSITQAAEAVPEKVAALVYLTAFLLPSGRSVIEAAQSDPRSEVMPNLVFAPDQSSATMKPEAIRSTFYADCSDADVALARSLLVPQAAAPFTAPVQTTAERWGSVRRVYIECTADRAISLEAQRAMHAQLPCQQVLSMETSHSPFFSAPDALAELLLSL